MQIFILCRYSTWIDDKAILLALLSIFFIQTTVCWQYVVNSVVEILKFGKISRLKFGQAFEANILFRLRAQGIIAISKLKFSGYV